MPHDALRMRWNFSFNANTIYCSQSFDGEIIERKNRINAQRKSPTLFAAFSHTHACARCAYCRRASNTTIYWSNNLKINDKKNSKHAALNSEWDGLSNNNCWSVVKIWSKLMRLSVLSKTILNSWHFNSCNLIYTHFYNKRKYRIWVSDRETIYNFECAPNRNFEKPVIMSTTALHRLEDRSYQRTTSFCRAPISP